MRGCGWCWSREVNRRRAGGLARTLAACFEELHPDVQAALAENLTIVARESQRRLNSHRTPANFLYW